MLQVEFARSRSTIHRQIDQLEAAGYPIVKQGGTVRLLNTQELPRSTLSDLQVSALYLAREQLRALEGSELLRAFDAFLAELRPDRQPLPVRFASRSAPLPSADVLQTLERAYRYRKQARIVYRAASRAGAASRLTVEPLLFNVVDGMPYILAHCVERGAERTYKLARIERVELLQEKATHRPNSGSAQAFAHAVKAWTGDVQPVSIQLDAKVAWLAHEYALPNQVVLPQSDGSVVIEARLAGLVEVSRWVLGWGHAARVLEPESLREVVRRELAGALDHYAVHPPARGPDLAKAKSTKRSNGRPAHVGTGHG